MLDYAALNALAAVVREGSFDRAAHTLHVTPSAISQRVRLLEQELNEALPALAPDGAARVNLPVAVNADSLATGRNHPPLTGQVARVDPVAFTKTSALGFEEQRVNVTVALKAPPEELQKLGDGFRVDARITVSAQDGALLVPSAALVRQGEGWQVFQVEAGKARARAGAFSDRNADSAWVKDGVKSGETVILNPGSGLKDGRPVRVRANG